MADRAESVQVIATLGTFRKTSVVWERGGMLYYRTVGSSADPLALGEVPVPGTLFDLDVCKPKYGKPTVVVEYANGEVWTAPLQGVELGGWRMLVPGRPTLE